MNRRKFVLHNQIHLTLRQITCRLRENHTWLSGFRRGPAGPITAFKLHFPNVVTIVINTTEISSVQIKDNNLDGNFNYFVLLFYFLIIINMSYSVSVCHLLDTYLNVLHTYLSSITHLFVTIVLIPFHWTFNNTCTNQGSQIVCIVRYRFWMNRLDNYICWLRDTHMCEWLVVHLAGRMDDMINLTRVTTRWGMSRQQNSYIRKQQQ